MKRIVLLLPFCLFGPAVAQWATPVFAPAVSTANADFDLSPSFIGLTLYFSSDRPSGGTSYEIFQATRTGPYTAFANPTHMPELGSAQTEGGPCPIIHELEIFFWSTRPGGLGGPHDIWRADRPSTSVPFNTPTPVTELNSTALDATFTMTIDGLRVYFGSTRPGGLGGYDIWTATRPNWSSPFGTPTPVTELNNASTDYTPHISPEGLTIFFASTRTGTLGSDDIYMATRLDVNSPFGTPVNVTALNSSASDLSPAFSMFSDELFLGTTRPGGLGSWDIYSARFTGLVATGIAGVGSAQELRFSDPGSPTRVYVAASSRGSTPGIPIDTRNLPLNFDLIFQLTIGGLPPIMTGYVGVLDQNGIGSGRINFAGFPQFVGLQFVTAFVVLDPAAPSAIRTISNAHGTQVR